MASEPIAPATQAEQPTDARFRHRVLVVDDNADAALSLEMMLQLMGCDTRTANDGYEALTVAAEFDPGIVLLDIGMPRLDGYETCRRLRLQPRGKLMTVIALTGWGQEESKRATREAGFDKHLVKPADPNELQMLVERLQAGE